MTNGYLEWLIVHGFEVKRNGIWASVKTPPGQFGWKLHLASTQFYAESLLHKVTPVLARLGVPFKVARSAQILGWLNEGEFGPFQVGKFMTMYPATPEESRLLADELVIQTKSGFAGPRIVTDLHLGGVVFTRYGSYTPPMTRDRLGNIAPVDPSGIGSYRAPFSAPIGVENPFADVYLQDQGTGPRTASIMGPGYVLLKPLAVHAKGTVFLALDVRRQEGVELVVLKEGRRYCMSDGFGRDTWERLRHQETIHRRIAGKVAVPRVAAPFEHAGNLYLPVEYIMGRTLAQRSPRPFESLPSKGKQALLADLHSITATLGDLHAEGIIHRDLSPRNVLLTPDGTAYLLDLELGYHVHDHAPPFMHGTPGFVSPQQDAGEAPTFADDVYSLGSLIINAITGIDPRRVLFTGEPGIGEAIRGLSGAPEWLCALTSTCVCVEPKLRPSLSDISCALKNAIERRPSSVWLVTATHSKLVRAGHSVNGRGQGSLHQLVSMAMSWLLKGSPRDEIHGLWLSPELEASGHDTSLRLPHAYRLYRSTSRGVAGVVYTLARLHSVGLSNAGVSAEASKAVDWLLGHDQTHDDQMPGLYFGEAGVAVAIAEAVSSGLVPQGEWFIPYLEEALSGPVDWPDLSHGAAGQGVAALYCGILLHRPDLAALGHRCVEYLLSHQAPDGSWPLPQGVRGLEGIRYTGLAHGAAGVIYFLAVYARCFSSTDALAAAERGALWLLGLASAEAKGRPISWPMRVGSDESWRWSCHGAPGIAVALLALFQATGSGHYADTARAALRSHPREVRYSNLSQCHGLSGLGEILLEAHRVLGEDEWLRRAERIGATVAFLARVDEAGASWLVENPYQPTADLMIGCGGVAHFLGRLTAHRERQMGLPLLLDPHARCQHLEFARSLRPVPSDCSPAQLSAPGTEARSQGRTF